VSQPSSNYQKYQTPNPVMRRVIRRFLDRIVAHVREARPERVVDLGSGEGMVARELARLPFAIEYRGIELSAESVGVAREQVPGLDFRQGNILTTEPERGWADVALCLEVLEHLDDPRPAVARIAEWTRSMAIVSVPWEPFFRTGNLLRGKYLASFGNHPEHVQQFGPASFEALLATRFRVVQVETCFPWLIARAAAPR
jgi:2-polyprenyl-3-methyl-5-hydroxy-6-metoxy-1,4-benzoquinol methylase